MGWSNPFATGSKPTPTPQQAEKTNPFSTGGTSRPKGAPKPATTTKKVGYVGCSCGCCGKTGVSLYRQADGDELCHGCVSYVNAQ